MRVLMATPEAVPFAKTGGLADVAGALPAALKGVGCDVRGILPYYTRQFNTESVELETLLDTRSLPFLDKQVECRILTAQGAGNVPWYFIDAPYFFDRDGLYTSYVEGGKDFPDNFNRFTFFAQATLWLMKELNWRPDVIHCHDWQTGLLPAYLRINVETPLMNTGDSFYAGIKTLFTIHNIAYQGLFTKDLFPKTGIDWSHFTPDALEYYNQLSFLKAGLMYGHKLNTVSQRYSEEIQATEAFGRGMEGVLSWRARDLSGILNGIDADEWNPATDPLIPAHFSADDLSGKAECRRELLESHGLTADETTPVIGIVGRLAPQKGFDLIDEAFDEIMELGVRMVVLGTGYPEYHDMFQKMAKKYPDQLAINLAFDNKLAHRIEAGSDMFLMPSHFEPCGLNQMYSLRYGTVPIVHATGGLADTIADYDPGTGVGNGFSFDEYTAEKLIDAVTRAVKLFGDRDTWRNLVLRGMKQDYSWKASAKKYLDLYEEMIGLQ